MDLLRGRAEDVEILVRGETSTVWGLTLRLPDDSFRRLRVDVPLGVEDLASGDELEVEVRRTAGGDDVLLCRKAESGAVLVDRTKGEDVRRTWWYVGVGLTLFVIIWFIVSNL